MGGHALHLFTLQAEPMPARPLRRFADMVAPDARSRADSVGGRMQAAAMFQHLASDSLSVWYGRLRSGSRSRRRMVRGTIG